MLKLAGIHLGKTPSCPQACQILHFQLNCDGLPAQRKFFLQFLKKNNSHLEMVKIDHSAEDSCQSYIPCSP